MWVHSGVWVRVEGIVRVRLTLGIGITMELGLGSVLRLEAHNAFSCHIQAISSSKKNGFDFLNLNLTFVCAVIHMHQYCRPILAAI